MRRDDSTYIMFRFVYSGTHRRFGVYKIRLLPLVIASRGGPGVLAQYGQTASWRPLTQQLASPQPSNHRPCNPEILRNAETRAIPNTRLLKSSPESAYTSIPPVIQVPRLPPATRARAPLMVITLHATLEPDALDTPSRTTDDAPRPSTFFNSYLSAHWPGVTLDCHHDSSSPTVGAAPPCQEGRSARSGGSMNSLRRQTREGWGRALAHGRWTTQPHRDTFRKQQPAIESSNRLVLGSWRPSPPCCDNWNSTGFQFDTRGDSSNE